MTRTAIQLPLPGFEQARGEWRSQYSRQMGEERPVRNRSGIEIQPLYSASDSSGDRYLEDLRFSGPVSLHAWHLSLDAPWPHLDTTAIDWPQYARGLQQTRSAHHRRGCHGDQPVALLLRVSRHRLRRGRSVAARHLRR
jgi:hypothetical protein